MRLGRAFLDGIRGRGGTNMPTVEEGIQNSAEGIMLAVNYIADNGQNVTNVMQSEYAGVQLAQGVVTYEPTLNLMRRATNTKIRHSVTHLAAQFIPADVESSGDPDEFDAANQASTDQVHATLDNLVFNPRGEIGGALRAWADEANLRQAWQADPVQAAQSVRGFVTTLNDTGKMSTSIVPSDLYESLRRLTMVVELMTPQPVAGAPVVPNPTLEVLQQRLAGNNFLTQRTQGVAYQLPMQTASTVILAQYALH